MRKVIDVINILPDSFLRAALIGLPRFWEVYRQPEDMPYEDAEVIYVTRNKEDFIPRHAVLLTTKLTAPSVESKYDVKRVFTSMTDEEKRKALGE